MTDTLAITIGPAEWDDLPEILALQRRAYRSEAVLLNDDTIPPLRETIEDTRRQFSEGCILKAVTAEGKLIGSVRGRREGETVHVGKLMVEPEYQCRGLGRRLLREIEQRCPASRYELFTSAKSMRNLSLYESMGYVRFASRALTADIDLVYLEKIGEPPLWQ